MLKRIFPIASLAGLSLLAGCATQPTTYPNFTATPAGQSTSAASFKQKTDTIFVVLDSSSSTNEIYDGDASDSLKFDIEKQFLNRFNKTIPSNIRLTSGIESFGFGPCLDWGTTKTNKEISSHNTRSFQAGLDQAECASGGSSLENALSVASTKLDNNTGNVALLVVSDGHHMSAPVLTEAQALQDKFGERLCIYTVWVGNENQQAGKTLLQGLSSISGCGQSVNVADVSTSAGVSSFVEDMLFTKSAMVAATAAPITDGDTDGDGVANSIDKCPNTPAGVIVDKTGCWKYIKGITFKHGKSTIRPGYESLFDNAIHVLKINPKLIVEIQGHTDSTGSAAFNQAFSLKRANTVKKLLVRNGINGDRITVKGFGESSPIDTNDTAEGRTNNRRVEFKASYKIPLQINK